MGGSVCGCERANQVMRVQDGHRLVARAVHHYASEPCGCAGMGVADPISGGDRQQTRLVGNDLQMASGKFCPQ